MKKQRTILTNLLNYTETMQRDEFFMLPFKEYLALSDEEREHIQLSIYQSQKKWIDAELERRGAEWILVCGGEVVESSETLRNYPSREKLMALGEERGFVPFVFVRVPLIEEESAWAALPHADFYPTLCVRNWQRGPLCTVNQHQTALAGRNLLLELPLRLELNGRRRITRVL